MTYKQEPIIQVLLIPSPSWFLRWARWVASGFACVGYLSGVLSTQHLTLVSFLLLTGTYGAWLVIYQAGQRRVKVRAHPSCLLFLFFLGRAPPFLPLSRTNPYCLP